MSNVTVTSPTTLQYSYGESVTTVAFPLPLRHRYTKGQQALVDEVTALGWNLDETAVRNSYGYHFDTLPEERRVAKLEQHPFIFVREDADGGWWQLELDYVSREYSYGSAKSFNKALLGAKIRKFTAEADKVEFDAAISGYPSYADGAVVLQKHSTARWASYNWVTGAASDDDRYTLREQVIALATDPGLVLWLAAERMFERAEARYTARREAERVEALRRRPLPASWDALKAAAKAVAAADGLSDTDALLEALKAAVAVVEDEVVVR